MASSPASAVLDQLPPAGVQSSTAPPVLGLLADLPDRVRQRASSALTSNTARSMPSLVAGLEGVPDARRRRGRRHDWTGILAIAACACLSGASSYVAIAEWATASGAAVLAALGVRALVPCETTLRRCLQSADAPALDAALGGWAAGQLGAEGARAASETSEFIPLAARRRAIALDGKTLRGSGPRAAAAPADAATTSAAAGQRVHLVAALDHASAITLGQVAASSKGGEVAAALALLADLDARDLLAGAVITTDAGFTARELAADVLARGGHWILALKGNQKIAHTRITALAWKDVPEAGRIHSVGHGRVETRTIRVIDLTGSSDTHSVARGDFFPGAAQAIKIVRRRRTRYGTWSVSTAYAITSLDYRDADPALLAGWVRGHWSVEAMH